jgi:hypothetical protein
LRFYRLIASTNVWINFDQNKRPCARVWDDQRRRDFANDPRNLLAVGGQVNFDKAFREVASWLPPNAAFRCAFVARWSR